MAKKGIALGFKQASEDQFSVQSTRLASSILGFVPEHKAQDVAVLMASCFQDGYLQGGIDAVDKLQTMQESEDDNGTADKPGQN